MSGVIPGFNTTVLRNLPRSMLLIQVESVLMGFAFLAMIIVRSPTHTLYCTGISVSTLTLTLITTTKHSTLTWRVLGKLRRRSATSL